MPHSIKRVALIFDDRHRPETTGFYCLRALRDLAEVEHFHPDRLAEVPRNGFDLYLNVDDGMRYPWPPDLHPCAWWAIDTHVDFAWSLQKARAFDFVFAAQRDGARQLREQVLPTATWLPLACDPEIHGKHQVEKRFDVCFVGNVLPGIREELVRQVQYRFADSYVGRCYFEEMAETYSASRVVFNRSVGHDVNMRVFEALAAGSLLMTNDLTHNGQAELFRDGVHLATYGDVEEMLDKIAFYLERDALREQIAAAGRAEVLAKHTYGHRMEKLLTEVLKSEDWLRAGAACSTPAPSREVPVPLFQQPPATPAVRDRSYFDFSRPELLALVPGTARRVLEVGCGAGRLGASIKTRQGAEVVGIELDQQAAAEARGRLDRVLLADAEKLDGEFAAGRFDCIVCGDVLEHMRDPGVFLQRARKWLDADGRLVASIPNVRNHCVVQALLQGNWTYEPAGLLDRDHVRFFTRREIEKLFYRAGYHVERIQVVPGPGFEEWSRSGRPGEVKVGRLHIAGLPTEEAEEFYAYQYLLSAAPAPRPQHTTTSIVIITHNQLAYTRQCVQSILQRTDEPFELIFVDNASSDGTVEYLRSLDGVKLIQNSENRGFPAAANQGMAAATGAQILLLNNDTVVTTGWLRRMLDALYRQSGIGLVGPCSNAVSGPQQVPVAYQQLEQLDGFAWDWGNANDGRLEATDRLVGFCLLMRRRLYETIGPMDERFGIGCFEDDDYTRRAMHAGYRAVIARDSFVHHFGGRTFIGSGVDFGALMAENQRRFREKWDGPANAATTPGNAAPDAVSAQQKYVLAKGPDGGLLIQRDPVDLSLCMIVRDNAGTIGPALQSIRPWVDEMIVVDTGSCDATPKIAAQCGARLRRFAWRDDFSAARNESLRHARGKWLFWMDSDDTIDAANGSKLRHLVKNHSPSAPHGYVMQVHCPGAGENGRSDVTVVDHVKLFRNEPAMRFEGRIHEQILPAIRRAGGDVAWSDVFVTHSGYDHSQAGQKKKRERDFRMLELELRDRPDHPFALFNLGMTLADVGEYERAIQSLRRSIARSDPGDSHVRKAYALIVSSLAQLGRFDDAWEACQQGRCNYPQDAELLFREGLLHQHLGRLEQAVEAYEAVLRSEEPRHFSSVDRGIHGFKTRQNLAVVFAEMGDHVRAAQQWRHVVEQMPDYSAGWRGIADALLRQAKHDEVLALTEHLAQYPALQCIAEVLHAEVDAARGDVPAARHRLQRAVDGFPDEPEPIQTLCRILFERAQPAEAEPALKRLIDRYPADASAHHNLGTTYLRMRRPADAVESYRKSLEHRPNHVESYVHLGHAHNDLGQIDRAIAAWRQALSIAPDNPAAKQALRK